jgi:hypothetical protein
MHAIVCDEVMVRCKYRDCTIWSKGKIQKINVMILPFIAEQTISHVEILTDDNSLIIIIVAMTILVKDTITRTMIFCSHPPNI